MRIPEELLHFIWRFRLFKPLMMKTTCGKQVQVIKPGQFNEHAGPDFLFAELKIAGQQWFGHIELHVDAKDWMVHRHHQDEAYNAVILHVIWEGEMACYLSDGTWIPNLNLQQLVDEEVLEKALDLLHNGHWLSCAYRMKKIPMHIKLQTVQRAAVERLEGRYQQIMLQNKRFKGDWERITLSMLAGSFGFKVNKQAFLDWAELINLKLLAKFADKPKSIQAMFFGQAGFLTAYKGKESYPTQLQKEYEYIKQGFGLAEMSVYQWKFLRMRPANFPTIRLAQLAGLYHIRTNWFSKIVSSHYVEDIKQELRNTTINKYWRTHYHFEKTTEDHSNEFSETFTDLLVINCFAPLLFAYGKHIRKTGHMDLAMEWLESIGAEENVVTRKYRKSGLPSFSAMESQGLLHLQTHYCDLKKCLNCPIGAYIIQQPIDV